MNSNTLSQVIYISHNCIEPARLDNEVREVLDVSRKRNASAGLTGALMFNERCFAQVLEGRCQDLEATFERIQCDLRHDRVVLLEFTAIERRHFENWTMGYVAEKTAARERFNQLTLDPWFDARRLKAGTLFGLLHAHLTTPLAA